MTIECSDSECTLPSSNQLHTTMHTYTFMYNVSVCEMYTLVQILWTEQPGDINERNEAKTGNNEATESQKQRKAKIKVSRCELKVFG